MRRPAARRLSSSPQRKRRASGRAPRASISLTAEPGKAAAHAGASCRGSRRCRSTSATRTPRRSSRSATGTTAALLSWRPRRCGSASAARQTRQGRRDAAAAGATSPPSATWMRPPSSARAHAGSSRSSSETSKRKRRSAAADAASADFSVCWRCWR